MAPVIGFIGGMFSFGAGAAFGIAGGAAFGGWVAGAGFASTVLGGIAVKLLTTVAISALTAALAPDPAQGGGLTISTTVTGEHQPETLILGRYATAGHAIAPPYTHGKNNVFMTHIVELCSAPGARLNRVMFADEWIPLGETPHPEYGYPVLGKHEVDGNIWVKYYDGTQTAADPMLVARYGAHPDRPWTADMIGTGICYAILTFGFHSKHLNQVPRYRFELDGIPLYDPRKDGSAGGVGAHRRSDPTTWERTNNAAVIGYNVMRGIPLPGGEVWGGDIQDASELPWAIWNAAMNRCDAQIALAGGGTEPAYRAGLEVTLDQPPAVALEEFFKACSATVADLGYGWGIVVGAPALPVYAFTDDDVIVSKPQELDPFPAIEETYNAVTARYPDPELLYETKEAPRRTNADWEAADAFGRRMSSLSLPAVPYKRQVQRLTRAWIEDARRFRTHVIHLPPDAAHVELIDTVDWSSVRNGYAGKDFSVHEITEDPRTGIRQLAIRERDPNDYGWTPGYELPSVPTIPGTTPPAPDMVSGFDAQPLILTDAKGSARRAAIRIIWDADILARGIKWQIRLAGQTLAALEGSAMAIEAGGATVVDGILPATGYEVRAQLIADRPTDWTGWRSLTTHPVLLGRDDIEADILADVDGLVDWMDDTIVELDGIRADMAAEATRIDGVVQDVRADLAGDVATLEGQIAAGLTSAQGYTDTAIESHDLTLQGQFEAVAGQIQQLTAALTSENLIINGKFAADTAGWTLTNAARFQKAGASDTLVLAAPSDTMIGIGGSTTGAIQQALNAFTVDANDRLQIRFSAASRAASRSLTLTFDWRDGTGAATGTPTVQTMTISPAEQWRVYSLQVDPPDTAVGAILTLDKTQTGLTLFMTNLEAATVNIAIEGRVTALEAARVTDEAALATHKTEVATRFAGSDAALTAEQTARSSADLALGNRVTAVEATNATQQTVIETHETAIATAEEAIAQVEDRIEATYGRTQLVRDPEFRASFRYWDGPDLSAARLLAKNAAHANALYHAMPGPRAFRFNWDADPANVIYSARYSVVATDVLVLRAAFFKPGGAPTGRVYVQFFDAAGVYLSDGPSLYGSANAWVRQVTPEFSPPAAAREMRVLVAKGSAVATGQAVYITGITLQLQTGYDALTSSSITEVRQAQASQDAAFASFVSTMNSTVASLDGRITTNATNITERYTKAQTDSAISTAVSGVTASLQPQINLRATTAALTALTARVKDTEDGLVATANSITNVTAEVGNVSGQGLFRIGVTANPTGVSTRIGLRAVASLADLSHASALFLEANTNGTSSVGVVAGSFYVTDGPAPGGVRTVPFFIKDGVTYMRAAMIEDASITNAKIGGALQSTNFVSGEGGSGWQIRKDGVAEFTNIKIRRQLEVASGTLNVGGFAAPGAATGGYFTLDDQTHVTRKILTTPVAISEWSGARRTYIATAGMTGSVSRLGSSDETYWGWTAEVLPLTRWSGNQSLRLMLKFWGQNVTSVSNCVVTWKIYEVS